MSSSLTGFYRFTDIFCSWFNNLSPEISLLKRASKGGYEFFIRSQEPLPIYLVVSVTYFVLIQDIFEALANDRLISQLQTSIMIVFQNVCLSHPGLPLCRPYQHVASLALQTFCGKEGRWHLWVVHIIIKAHDLYLKRSSVTSRWQPLRTLHSLLDRMTHPPSLQLFDQLSY